MAYTSHGEENQFLTEINMVPLIDISLVLLIIFMIITPQMMMNSIKVQLPKSTSKDTVTTKNIIVTVEPDGTLFVNNEPVAAGQLTDTVISKMVDKPENAVIYADKSVPISIVVDVIDQVKAGGMNNISITTEQKLKQAVE